MTPSIKRGHDQEGDDSSDKGLVTPSVRRVKCGVVWWIIGIAIVLTGYVAVTKVRGVFIVFFAIVGTVIGFEMSRARRARSGVSFSSPPINWGTMFGSLAAGFGCLVAIADSEEFDWSLQWPILPAVVFIGAVIGLSVSLVIGAILSTACSSKP